MPNILDDIIAHKLTELASGHYHHERTFYNALKKPGLSIIAEVKRASPSAGELGLRCDANEQACKYLKAGADAISVLTDKKYFKGALQDLIDVRHAVQPLPIIQKDFIIDKRQILEAAKAQASAILLIVAGVKDQLKSLYDFARDCNLDVLVEAHTHDEVNRAIDIGADIIGINNRNLKTFKTDIQHSLNLIDAIPDNVIAVSESGIYSEKQTQALQKAGFDAVLIGEALVRAPHPGDLIKAFKASSAP
jgi:indole-3-glycerol phosphate synthase